MSVAFLLIYFQTSAMALSKMGWFRNLPAVSSRIVYKGKVFLIDSVCLRRSVGSKYLNMTKTANIHFSGTHNYPAASGLFLPDNICEIFHNKISRLTLERARDSAASILLYRSGLVNLRISRQVWNNQNLLSDYWGSLHRRLGDAYVNSHDCFSIISLNSSMQSIVPKFCCSTRDLMHLNMPGGKWAIDGKYVAEYVQKSHYAVLKQFTVQVKCGTICSYMRASYSTDISTSKNTKLANENKTTVSNTENLSNRDRLKRALKDYGYTVVVFHVGISLVSLGVSYILISSGLDIASILNIIGVSNEKLEGVMTQTSTFLIAYALHKFFAPIRISITLFATPFIVRYLRKVGILKRKKV